MILLSICILNGIVLRMIYTLLILHYSITRYMNIILGGGACGRGIKVINEQPKVSQWSMMATHCGVWVAVCIHSFMLNFLKDKLCLIWQ